MNTFINLAQTAMALLLTDAHADRRHNYLPNHIFPVSVSQELTRPIDKCPIFFRRAVHSSTCNARRSPE